MALILSVLLFPFLSWAQIVTSSFDRTTLSINPAAATSRNFSQAAIFANFRNNKTEATQNDFTTFKQEEEIVIKRAGIYFTGHGRFAPEVYISKDTAEKTTSGTSDEDHITENDMINNFVNLGLLMTKNLAIGFKYYSPSYKYKDEFTIKFPDNTSQSIITDVKSSVTGMGAGFTYLLSNTVHFGGYYCKITNKEKTTNIIDDGGGEETTTDDVSDALSQYGAGLSYLKGGIGKGMRAEIAYSKMIQPSKFENPPGEEFYVAVDFSTSHLIFGGYVKYRKNAYYDHIELMDFVIGDRVFNDSFTPSYGGHISLLSGKGHTLGVSGIVYDTKGKRTFYGLEQDVSTKITQVTLTYAYLF